MGMTTYDLYGISKIIERGLTRKLELVETAIAKLEPNLEPISITETFVFLANKSTGQMFRFDYSIQESNVHFSKPVTFNIDSSTKRLEEKTKKIVRNIVEALAENDTDAVDFYKAQWLAAERQQYQLQSTLDMNVGVKTDSVAKARDFVSEAIESTRGARSVMKKGSAKTLFTQLVAEGEVTVTPETATFNVEPESRQKLLHQRIVDGRMNAKSLHESPVFSEYVSSLYEGDAEDRAEAVQFIGDNYQEIYCLSLSEQSDLFLKALSSKKDVDKAKVVESVLAVGQYATSQPEIAEQLATLTSIVEAENGNFHERMQIIEDTINTRTFTNNDVSVIRTVLEKALEKPSEFLSPEFVIEMRKAYNRITEMVNNGNYDDRLVASVVHLLSNFYPQTMQIGEAEYEEFFRSKLDKYGVNSPEDIPADKKDDFFDEVDREWKSDEEGGENGKVVVDDENDEMADKNIYGDEEETMDESVDPQTGFAKGHLESLLEKKEDSIESPYTIGNGGGSKPDDAHDDEGSAKAKESDDEEEFGDEDDAFKPAEELNAKAKAVQTDGMPEMDKAQNAGDDTSTEITSGDKGKQDDEDEEEA